MNFDRNIRVSKLMTSEVVSVGPNDNLLKVESIFDANSFHHIPVVNSDNRVLGMISKADINKVQHSLTIFNTREAKKHNQSFMHAILASEIMSKNTAMLRQDDSALVAVGIFRENFFHAMPVVDKDGKLAGMLTTYDLLTYAYNEPVFIE